jgi:serine/threonine protein kinase
MRWELPNIFISLGIAIHQNKTLIKAGWRSTSLLHSHHIIYRGVKGDNVLLFSNGDVKISELSPSSDSGKDPLNS